MKQRTIRDPVEITVDGKKFLAERGEPVAISLLAMGRMVLSRSVKYHRPRGPLCLEGRCDGCLMRVEGVPNVMTCKVPAQEGLTVETQNVLGNARVDFLSVADWLFPDSMDHHHMFTRFAPINRLMQKVARRIAGIGRLPDVPMLPLSVREEKVDVLVVGAGGAGIRTANAAAKKGATVLLVEENIFGGTRFLLEKEVPSLGPPVRLSNGCGSGRHLRRSRGGVFWAG